MCCLVWSFVSPGLCTGKKAVAVVKRTKEDRISCVLMRGELLPVPFPALTGGTLTDAVSVCRAAGTHRCCCLLSLCPSSHLHLLKPLLCLLQVGKEDFCTPCNIYIMACPLPLSSVTLTLSDRASAGQQGNVSFLPQ